MRRLAIDLHVHSEDSYDADEPVERLLERAVRAGLDGVVVTDHDSIHESRRAAALAADYGLVGLPGVEVSTADGHLLALGVVERPSRGEPLAETVSRVHELGGVAVVPHPFQRSRHGVASRISRARSVQRPHAHGPPERPDAVVRAATRPAGRRRE